MLSGRTTDDDELDQEEEEYPIEPASYKRIKTDESQGTNVSAKMIEPSAKPEKTKRATQSTKRVTKLAKGASAIIASLGFMAAANQAGGTTKHSQALVEVKNEYMPPEHQPFSGDFDFVHNEDLKIIAPMIGSGGHYFSLDDTYMSFDIRESYLQRQANPLSNKADSIIISKEDYETKAVNVWRSHDSSRVYAAGADSSTALDFYTGAYSMNDKVSLQKSDTFLTILICLG